MVGTGGGWLLCSTLGRLGVEDSIPSLVAISSDGRLIRQIFAGYTTDLSSLKSSVHNV